MSAGVNDSERGAVSIPSSIPPFFHSQLSPSADLAVAIFLITTGVVSVVGNGVVLLVLGKKGKRLRPHDLMTINLAVCDFGYSLFGSPFFITSSLSHAWVFGESGCLFYGIQGFVFGIGSLITTCLISLDRAFKICSIKYGQWIERSHASLSIVLVWVYTLFWSLLPMLGFGSYGPEPYATSCTINWWMMKSSLNDRIYIFLILTLCFVGPTLVIVTCYLAIMMTVYRSNRMLASISSSASTHSSKELRLTKTAAVVCLSFLLAWTPYAIISFYSALTAKEEVGDDPEMLRAESSTSPTAPATTPRLSDFLALPNLLNWTSSSSSSSSSSQDVSSTFQQSANALTTNATVHRFKLGLNPTLGSGSQQGTVRVVSNLRPEMTLIPAMFAKSHCMVNPFIYQIMNREFREDVYYMFCGRGLERHRTSRRGRGRSDSEFYRSSISLSYCHSWRRRSTSATATSLESSRKGLKKSSSAGGSESESRAHDTHRGSWQSSVSSSDGWASLDVNTMDTHINIVERDRANEMGRGAKKEQVGPPLAVCYNL
ncbi:pinopsin-like [Engraulis encrasicolus]|uniref:pinopsin-like n=1 Tax=Engraulis encrasicolus TaxID=184585 RepID=UPI002FD6E6A4